MFAQAAILLLLYRKYTFNSTVNVEIMSKYLKTLTNPTLLENISKKMLIEQYNSGKVNHLPVPH